MTKVGPWVCTCPSTCILCSLLLPPPLHLLPSTSCTLSRVNIAGEEDSTKLVIKLTNHKQARRTNTVEPAAAAGAEPVSRATRRSTRRGARTLPVVLPPPIAPTVMEAPQASLFEQFKNAQALPKVFRYAFHVYVRSCDIQVT